MIDLACSAFYLTAPGSISGSGMLLERAIPKPCPVSSRGARRRCSGCLQGLLFQSLWEGNRSLQSYGCSANTAGPGGGFNPAGTPLQPPRGIAGLDAGMLWLPSSLASPPTHLPRALKSTAKREVAQRDFGGGNSSI